MSSVMSQLRSSGVSADKSDWTKHDVRLAVGMKLLGAKRKDIAIATDHPVNSVTYCLTRKFKDDAALAKFTEFDSAEQYTDYAESHLRGVVESDVA